MPAHLFLKANWSKLTINNNTDICELEARFYHESANMPALPAARCSYADWDGDGSGQGVVVLEDLADAGGKFGHSTDVIGIDGVANALEGLATLHGAWWGQARWEESRVGTECVSRRRSGWQPYPQKKKTQ